MLSYSWAYDVVKDIASGLESFCQNTIYNKEDSYAWICCLCVNQHRVHGTEVPFEEFRDVFKSRVRMIGHLVPLMSPWDSPAYITRAWCVMELFTAIEDKIDITITMPENEAQKMRQAMMERNLDSFWAALGTIRVEQAEATVETDKEMILRIIKESGGGCAAVNTKAVQHLRNWVVKACESHLAKQRLHMSQNDVAQYCLATARLHRNLGGLDEADKLIDEAQKIRYFELQKKEGCKIEFSGVWGKWQQGYDLNNAQRRTLFLRASIQQTKAKLHARRLSKLDAELASVAGEVKYRRREPPQVEGALKDFEHAFDILEMAGTQGSEFGAWVLWNIGSCKRRLKRFAFGDALDDYSRAKRIRDDTSSMETKDGSALLASFGAAHFKEFGENLKEKDLEKATNYFQQAKAVLDRLGQMGTPDGARVIMQLGKVKKEQGDMEGAKQDFSNAKRIYTLTGTEQRTAVKDLDKLLLEVSAAGECSEAESSR